jgi:galactose-1-phosphate uridylyltransferase
LASSSIPDEPAKEQSSLKRHQESHGNCLLCRYFVAREIIRATIGMWE